MENDVLAVRKKGQLVHLTAWEEAEITCEDRGNMAVLTRMHETGNTAYPKR